MIKRFLNFIFLLLGVGLIFGAIFMAVGNEGASAVAQGEKNSILRIIDPSSIIFIFLMLIGSALVSYGLTEMTQLVGLLFLSPYKANYQIEVLNKNLKKMADVYYQQGVSKIRENIPFKTVLPVWRVVIQQLEINLPIRDIKDLLYNDADSYRLKISLKINMINNLSSLAPSFGVLGTVIGLIKLLANMEDAATIGPNMSLALMTTLYGIFFGSILMKPLAARLDLIRNAYMNSYRQAFFWLDILEQKKPTFYIEEDYSKTKQRKKQ